jgi:hypothetical protein
VFLEPNHFNILETSITSSIDGILLLNLKNASLENRVSSLTSSLDAYELLRNRFRHKHVKVHLAGIWFERDDEELAKALLASGADVTAVGRSQEVCGRLNDAMYM